MFFIPLLRAPFLPLLGMWKVLSDLGKKNYILPNIAFIISFCAITFYVDSGGYTLIFLLLTFFKHTFLSLFNFGVLYEQCSKVFACNIQIYALRNCPIIR
jgi:hypothetical protein